MRLTSALRNMKIFGATSKTGLQFLGTIDRYQRCKDNPGIFGKLRSSRVATA